MIKDLVSIIIPLYNGERYIEYTLNSILESTHKALEIVIVNDGSMDKSLEICEKIKKKDNRIRVFTKKNEGIASARNCGIEKANGEYICFCDQDDIVAIETYARQIECIKKNQSDFCMCSTGRSINGKTSSFESLDDAYYEKDQILEELLYPLIFNGYNVPISKTNNVIYSDIWNCMFQIRFLKENGIRFRSYVNFEDDLLFKIEALSKASKVSTINYIGYYWRVNLKSETYAHKFVDNINEKQQKCYEDMLTSLGSKVSDNKVLELFTQVTFCKQYLDAVHNLTSPVMKKNRNTIKRYYDNVIYSRDFMHCIEARKYLKRGRVKPLIILPILAKRMTIVCYLAEILLDHILLMTLHSQILTKIERRIKCD